MVTCASQSVQWISLSNKLLGTGITTLLSQIKNRLGEINSDIMSLILLGVTIGWPSSSVSQALQQAKTSPTKFRKTCAFCLGLGWKEHSYIIIADSFLIVHNECRNDHAWEEDNPLTVRITSYDWLIHRVSLIACLLFNIFQISKSKIFIYTLKL